MAIARTKRNLIKKGQVWQKKDTGVLIEIVKRNKEPCWTCRRVDSRGGKHSKKRSHHISMYDLVKHWELL